MILSVLLMHTLAHTSSRYKHYIYLCLQTVSIMAALISCVQECLMNLLSCKTVIYCTHQLEFLHAADLILVNFNISNTHFSLLVKHLLLIRMCRTEHRAEKIAY